MWCRAPALVLPVAVALSGCAHSPAPPPAVAAPAAPQARVEPAPEADGIWEWAYSSSDDRGDLRVEQEEWHLQQHSGQLSGYYDRVVHVISTDDALFRCNRKLNFTKYTRVQVRGRIAEGQIDLNEVAFDVRPGPCDDGARNLVRYRGQVKSDAILLEWAAGARQTLHRASGGPSLVRASGIEPDGGGARGRVGDSGAPGPSSSEPVAPLGERWEWMLKSIDAQGDERVEREEWHLVESDGAIRGYYDRKVTVVPAAAENPVQASLPVDECLTGRHEVETRYTIQGLRAGDRVDLSETEFSAGPSKCDNGKRRLDRYRGSLSSAGDELKLDWGSGHQILRRVK